MINRLRKFISLILINFYLLSCTAIGTVSGAIIDRSHHRDALNAKLSYFHKNDSIYLETSTEKIKAIFIQVDEDVLEIRRDSVLTQGILFRDIRTVNEYQKSYKWTSILVSAGILIDSAIIYVLAGAKL